MFRDLLIAPLSPMVLLLEMLRVGTLSPSVLRLPRDKEYVGCGLASAKGRVAAIEKAESFQAFCKI